MKGDVSLSKALLYFSFAFFMLMPSSLPARPKSEPPVFTQHTSDIYQLLHPSLVKKFYELNNNQLFWFSPGHTSLSLRQTIVGKIDSCAADGLKKEKYHLGLMRKNLEADIGKMDSTAAMNIDALFTDAALAFFKDVYGENSINELLMYDEISPARRQADESFLVGGLLNVRTPQSLLMFIRSIECNDPEYVSMRNELQTKRDSLSSFRKKQLVTSLQVCRWMHHFRFDKWIVVNISSATLRYYEGDNVKLKTKVIVGKPSTRTPRFAAHCNEVILYPYWNVPNSIAVNELLPMFKRDPSNVDNLNMQILDAKGNILNHHKINWRNYSRGYFPFRVRQSTGCDNSLGVIKFNLTSPFSVYLHDTNNKGAFLSGLRYYSHGCIRVEEPVKLANYLLNNAIDSTFLEACLKDQLPKTISIQDHVPVFVIYQPVEADVAGRLKYYKDIYNLLK